MQAKRHALLPAALERIHANKLIIDSFLKGKYGYPGADESAYQKETQVNQNLWEINRKLDLLIHMFLAEEFRSLMNSTPKDVNISAIGHPVHLRAGTMRWGTLVEIHLILPMVPLLFVRLAGEVIRQKAVTSTPRQTVRRGGEVSSGGCVIRRKTSSATSSGDSARS
ncbi:MAG: hypothetical protein MZU91_02845 [Desulfosudis oleivorans]|nr:hypothetical protein [Desulfosudis oleivorans]